MNSRGFSLVQGLVAVGIMSLIAMVMAGMFTQMAANQKRNNVIFMLENKKLNLGQLLRDDRTWHKILHHERNDSQMTCLRKMTDCLPTLKEFLETKGELIPVVVDASGELLVDSTVTGNSTGGLSYEGNICYDFIDPEVNLSKTGNATCPLRLEVRWLPVCDVNADETCFNPQVRITGTYKHFPHKLGNMNLNFDKYKIEIVRNGITPQVLQKALSLQTVKLAPQDDVQVPKDDVQVPPAATIDPQKLEQQGMPKEFTEGVSKLLEAQKMLQQLQKEMQQQQGQ